MQSDIFPRKPRFTSHHLLNFQLPRVGYENRGRSQYPTKVRCRKGTFLMPFTGIFKAPFSAECELRFDDTFTFG